MKRDLLRADLCDLVLLSGFKIICARIGGLSRATIVSPERDPAEQTGRETLIARLNPPYAKPPCQMK